MGAPFQTDADGRFRRSISIGETLQHLGVGKGNAPKPIGTRRTGQPVRRSSYYPHDRRAQIWRPLASSNREAHRIISARMKAAEHYDRKHKEAGKWNGPLGAIGLEVLRELYRIVEFKTGRLEPAINTLCEKLRRSKGAVVAALRRLKEHGFLDWVRRSEPTDCEGAGPQVRQITNAYAFSLPRCATTWVQKKLGNGPPPDCELARAAADKIELAAMIDTLPLPEQMRVSVVDDELAERLAKLAEALEKNCASLSNREKPTSEE
jgi:hypothetical protein